MHTEEQAKRLWCPFARVSAAGLGNRYPMDIDLANGHAFARCIGSQCSAWRWADKEFQYEKGSAVRTPEGEGWEPSGETFCEGPPNGPVLQWWRRPRPNRQGYCGLVGQPS